MSGFGVSVPEMMQTSPSRSLDQRSWQGECKGRVIAGNHTSSAALNKLAEVFVSAALSEMDLACSERLGRPMSAIQLVR